MNDAPESTFDGMDGNHLPQLILTDPQREALLELKWRGPGGSFDQMVMSQLFCLGLVEVCSHDRRVVLTPAGSEICDTLACPVKKPR